MTRVYFISPGYKIVVISFTQTTTDNNFYSVTSDHINSPSLQSNMLFYYNSMVIYLSPFKLSSMIILFNVYMITLLANVPILHHLILDILKIKKLRPSSWLLGIGTLRVRVSVLIYPIILLRSMELMQHFGYTVHCQVMSRS